MSRPPLLVVDGDSFAHRAYHALPKSMRRSDGGPGNALVGFTNMLLRLWQDERHVRLERNPCRPRAPARLVPFA